MKCLTVALAAIFAVAIAGCVTGPKGSASVSNASETVLIVAEPMTNAVASAADATAKLGVLADRVSAYVAENKGWSTGLAALVLLILAAAATSVAIVKKSRRGRDKQAK